jgi:hypothetical protein
MASITPKHKIFDMLKLGGALIVIYVVIYTLVNWYKEGYGSPNIGDGLLNNNASYRSPSAFTKELQGVLAADGFYGVQNIPKPPLRKPPPPPSPYEPPREPFVNAFAAPSSLQKTSTFASKIY